VNTGWCSEQKVEKADTLAVNIALQRLEIVFESFELQKEILPRLWLTSCPVQQTLSIGWL
jgi:hypothetical protein